MTISWTSNTTDHVELVITNSLNVIVYADYNAPTTGHIILME